MPYQPLRLHQLGCAHYLALPKKAVAPSKHTIKSPTASPPMRTAPHHRMAKRGITPGSFSHLKPAPALSETARPPANLRVDSAAGFARKVLAAAALVRGERFDPDKMTTTAPSQEMAEAAGQQILAIARQRGHA